MSGLRIAPNLTLPPEIITDTLAIFGTRGSGKSTSGTVIVEEAHALDLPTVVLDPKGDWWGLRSSADGKAGGGLPFIIFGGDHADVPLEPTAGVLLADLIVDQRINAVLDLSAMSKTGQRRFAMDFAERLYRRNREALLVVVDEADIVIPQRVTADMLRLLGAWEDIAKRGRGRGLGLCVLTQRPQDVAKSVLDEMHALLLHGMVGPRAMKSIREWVDNHADEGAPTAEILGSLGSLEPGEGWVWAPFRHVRQRVRVRRIHTFDSHATPKPGQARVAPRARAQVDLEALGDQIAATVEKAKAEDPRELRRQVTDLQAQLANVQPVVECVEVPVLAEDLVVRLEQILCDLKKHGQQAVDVAGDMLDQLGRWSSPIPPVGAKQGSSPDRSSAPVATWPDATRGSRVSGTPNPPGRPTAGVRETRPSPAAGTPNLAKAERAILTVVAQQGSVARRTVGVMAGYAHGGGGFGNAISALRTMGYVTGGLRGEPLAPTQDGIDALGAAFSVLPTGQDLVDHWKAHGKVGKAEGEILDVLVDHHPGTLSKVQVAAATASGYNPAGGGFGNALSRLRTLGLIEGDGSALRASDAIVGGAP